MATEQAGSSWEPLPVCPPLSSPPCFSEPALPLCPWALGPSAPKSDGLSTLPRSQACGSW